MLKPKKQPEEETIISGLHQIRARSRITRNVPGFAPPKFIRWFILTVPVLRSSRVCVRNSQIIGKETGDRAICNVHGRSHHYKMRHRWSPGCSAGCRFKVAVTASRARTHSQSHSYRFKHILCAHTPRTQVRTYAISRTRAPVFAPFRTRRSSSST